MVYELTFENESEGRSFKILKRYSELKNLNDILRKETPSNSFPKFPPKKFFGSSNEEFIIKRQQELNSYFISLSNEFSQLPSLIKFIEESKKNAIAIEDNPNKSNQKKKKKKL